MNARLRSLSLALAVPALLFAATSAQADQASLATAPDSGSFSEIAKSHLPAVVDAARDARDRLLPADDAAATPADDATQLTVVTPVPEPETYALMLAGLGVLGAAAKRRAAKRRAADATR